MEKIICKECGKTFEYEKMSSCKAQLKRHIRGEHHMSVLDYVVKYDYNGERPKCPCGCGHYLNLNQSNDRWKFTKYYADTCYGNLVRSCNEEVLKQFKETHKRDFDIVKYYESHYDRDTYEKAFEMFKTKQFSLSDVSASYKIDKRTLKKVWIALEITTSEELTDLLEYTKYQLSTINNKTYIDDENMLGWMYNMIKKHPGKYTIHSLIKEYNKCFPTNPCEHYDSSLLKALYRLYGDEIDILLSIGYHSSEEYEFYNVLKFYIRDYIIKLGKRFVLNGDYVYFDFLIGSRILIEYDSDGKFHSEEKTKENDERKEKFAKENGYIFLRLTKEDIKKIDTIIKIKKILEDEIS